MKKKCQVVMLPTNQKVIKGSNLFFESEPTINKLFYVNSYGNRHLYILSDDEIKEGDWIYLHTRKVRQVNRISYISKEDSITQKEIILLHFDDKILKGLNVSSTECQKIVATTDSLLNLPRPSNEFIRKYCEKNGIDEVLVEYEDSRDKRMFPLNWIPKIAPDNTISIYPIKESYTKEEVIKLCQSAFNMGVNKFTSFEKWIERNL